VTLPALKNYRHSDEFGKWLGYRIRRIRKGVVESELKIRKDHLSPAGRVHGGVISAYFDWAFGAAVFNTLEEEDFCSTVEIKVNYLRPVDLGDSLRATTRVIFRGKRLCVLHGFIHRNRDREPAAMATATFNIVNGGSSK
jgi:uncharacterized protein (TIGR00369 family)